MTMFLNPDDEDIVSGLWHTDEGYQVLRPNTGHAFREVEHVQTNLKLIEKLNSGYRVYLSDNGRRGRLNEPDDITIWQTPRPFGELA